MDYDQRQYDRLLTAKLDALRFIERADAAMNAIRDKDSSFGRGKFIGSAKRASMDLTRSLVWVRKSPFED